MKPLIFLKRNSSTILTCVGAVGVVGTTVIAVRATPKAIKLLEEAENNKGDKLTILETVQAAGIVYIPSAVVGLSTIACIFGANMLNTRNQASLMSAYALLDKSYKEYRSKTQDLYGEDADDRIKSEISKTEYKKNDISVDDNKILFFDFNSMRYFESTMAEVLNAETHLNAKYAARGFTTLNDFYDILGLECTSYGAQLGWYGYSGESQITFKHEKTELEEGLECYVISTPNSPIDYCNYL